MLVLLALRRGATRTPGLLAVLVCFAVAMSIETEVVLHAHTLDGPIKALALCVLLGLGLYFPLPEPAEGPTSAMGRPSRASNELANG